MAYGSVNVPGDLSGKQDLITGVPGQVVGIGADGKAAARNGWSNPNLLDNCDFQIWQKYPNGIYTGVPYNAYIPDRWIITSSDGSIENRIERLPGGGIANREGPAVVLGTRLESASDYNGKVMTLSCLKREPGASDIALVSATAIATDWSSDTNIINFFGGIQWLISGAEIYRYKLEIGPVQTLAHKEGGTWVLNDPPPNKALELAKCQRYQLVVKEIFGGGMPGAIIGISMGPFVYASLPCSLRTAPTVTFSSSGITAYRGVSREHIPITEIVVAGFLSNSVYLRVALETAFDSKDAAFIEISEDGWLLLDANL